jgi:hypothetical protein
MNAIKANIAKLSKAEKAIAVAIFALSPIPGTGTVLAGAFVAWRARLSTEA